MEDFALLCYSRNTPYSYDAHTPVSILALGTYLEQNGVAIEYFDERIDDRRTFDDLIASRPRVVGFSVIGGYQIASAARLSRIVRRFSPESRILWGGIGPTTLAEETLREDFVDYVVLGEGEETLLELFSALREGDSSAARVPGILFKKEGRIRRNRLRPFPDVEKLPFVYQGKALTMLKRYLKRSLIREAVGYEVSRGCPFLCTFCYSPNFHNDTRVKSVGKVARELEAMKRLGVRNLDIYDDTLFGARKKDFPYYLELLRRGDYSWIGNLRIDMLDETLLRQLEASGCKWIYFGIESNDDKTLRTLKKGITAGDIHNGIRLMSRSNIPAVYSIIYGLPLEGEKDKVDCCLDFAEEIHRLHPSAEIQVQSYVPLPGSTLYADAIRFGFVPPRQLLDWVRHDHFGVTNPWLDAPNRANEIYISTFLAFRYRRHLSHFPIKFFAYPLHRLGLWRIQHRCFKFYVEKFLYDGVLATSEMLVNLYFWLQDLLPHLFSRSERQPPIAPKPSSIPPLLPHRDHHAHV